MHWYYAYYACLVVLPANLLFLAITTHGSTRILLSLSSIFSQKKFFYIPLEGLFVYSVLWQVSSLACIHYANGAFLLLSCVKYVSR